MDADGTNGIEPVYHEPEIPAEDANPDEMPPVEFFEMRFTNGARKGLPCAWGMDLPNGEVIIYYPLDRSIIRCVSPERWARRMGSEIVWL